MAGYGAKDAWNNPPCLATSRLRLPSMLIRRGRGPVQLLQRSLGDRLGSNPEMLVQFLVGSACAECRHADEAAIGADDLVPALPHRRLDGNIDLGRADDLRALRSRQRAKELEARHRDDARRDAAFAQELACLDCNGHFRSGRKQRDLRDLLFRRNNLVGAGGAPVRLLAPEPQLRLGLAGEGQNAWTLRALDGELPALDRLDGIA